MNTQGVENSSTCSHGSLRPGLSSIRKSMTEAQLKQWHSPNLNEARFIQGEDWTAGGLQSLHA